MKVSYWNFHGDARTGRLVINRHVIGPTVRAMRRLFELNFPIRRMRLVDAYGGNRETSAMADNTSGFNCQRVDGAHRWSAHAYGRAIDLNPLENPHVARTGHVSPAAGEPFVSRSRHARGLIHPHSNAIGAFTVAGWSWGGAWRRTKDYGHFSIRPADSP